MQSKPVKMRVSALNCGAVSFFSHKHQKKETASKFSSQLRSEKSSRYAETRSRSRKRFLRRSRRTRQSIVQNAAIRFY